MDKLFDLYLKELLAWNEKFNLTAITDPAEIRRKHFEDSLLLSKIISLTDQSIIDVGAGAGFPGIPLKIACPEIKLTLLEATQKKVEFLGHLIKVLDLKDTEAIWARAENFARKKRELFDLAVSRAVADLRTLCEYCLPFVKIGGLMVAYKEIAIEKEIAAAKPAIELLGGKLKDIHKFPQRSLVIIEKITLSPEKYPRRPGLAKKRPL